MNGKIGLSQGLTPLGSTPIIDAKAARTIKSRNIEVMRFMVVPVQWNSQSANVKVEIKRKLKRKTDSRALSNWLEVTSVAKKRWIVIRDVTIISGINESDGKWLLARIIKIIVQARIVPGE